MGQSVALVIAFALVLRTRAEFPTKEFVELLKPTIERCEEKTGVDKRQWIENSRRRFICLDLVEQFSRGESMADDPNLKCYMKCIFVDLELLNESTGVFRYDKMLHLLPEEMKSVALDMGHACVHFKGEQGDDLCQVSFDLHRCWQKRDPKHYFIF